MRTSRDLSSCLAVVSAMLALGACTGKQQERTPVDSATSGMAMTAPLPPLADYGHCGGTNQDGTNQDACRGGLRQLTNTWTTPDNNGDLADAVADRFGQLNWADGSQVAVQRKSKNGGLLWTRVDAIDDANKVFINEIKHPVVMARFTVVRGNGEDNGMGASSGGGKEYFFVVNPDSWDGTPNNESYWAVVEYKNSGKAKIVRSGSRFMPCKDANGQYHPQKAAPFANFVSCSISSFSFETIMAWKGVLAADSTKSVSIFSTLPPDVQLGLRLAAENDDPLWISCGLGCCSTQG